MIREIVKDTEYLSIPCKTVTKLYAHVRQVIDDMLDTAMEYEESENCVGLAANQISSNLRIILCCLRDKGWTVMINPVITNKSKQTHPSTEGCLSLEGTRTVDRYNRVEAIYKTPAGKLKHEMFSGFDSNIVQHEIDHINGKLI